MRVLLISFNTERAPYCVYPLGMAVIAHALIQAGHTVKQLDHLASPDITTDVLESLDVFQPDLIGISLRNIDNVDIFTSEKHWSIDSLKSFVHFIKGVTDIPLFLGGAGFSLMPEAILTYCGADYGIVGEGEELVCSIIDKIEKKEPVERITTASTPPKAQSIGGAYYEPELVQFYTEKSGVINIQTKRGCPKNCVYCSYPLLEGRLIRPREPLAVIDEIRHLQRTTTFQEIFFTDSVFNDRYGNWLTLLETMARHDVVVPWTAFFEPENLTKEALELCKRTGLKAMEFGTDACSDATLQAMGKGFTFETVYKTTELCVQLHIPCMHFVIAGGPGETIETLTEGLQNIAHLPKSLVTAFLGVRILPNTRIHALAIKEKVIRQEQSLLTPQYYFSPHLSRELADETIRQAFQGNRLRLYPPSDNDFRMNFLQKRGLKGILWDTMLQF